MLSRIAIVMRRLIAAYYAGLKGYEAATSLLYSAARFRPRARHAFYLEESSRSNVIVIAMNGPTLTEDLARIDQEDTALAQIDYAVANHFADTDCFSVRRPAHYFFSDPYFWDDESDPILIEKRNATYDRIAQKTCWPMRVYFPVHAKLAAFVDRFSGQDMITLHPFNAASLPSEYSTLLGTAWKIGFCAPYGQNVLIHAIYGAIQLGYRRIYIAGAGFSFHEQIHVDQTNNIFMKRRRHVYGEIIERAYVDQRKSEPATVATEFKALYNAFRSLEALSNYARWRRCEVINYSNYSYLDMFDRPFGKGVIEVPR